MYENPGGGVAPLPPGEDAYVYGSDWF